MSLRENNNFLFLRSRLPFVINFVYFWYSLIFLIARIYVMIFIASSVHEESRKPLKFLREITSEGWCHETERFFQLFQKSCIAMSGKKFFHITRGIIITIAGSIITYELVLLQFGADKIESDMFDPCKNIDKEVEGSRGIEGSGGHE